MTEDIPLTRRVVQDAATHGVMTRDAVRRHYEHRKPWRGPVCVGLFLAVVLYARLRHGVTAPEAVLVLLALLLGVMAFALALASDATAFYRRTSAHFRPDTTPGSVVELGLGETGLRCREDAGDLTRSYGTFSSAGRHGRVVRLEGGKHGSLVFDGALFTGDDLERVQHGIATAAGRDPETVWRPSGQEVPLTARAVVDETTARRMASEMVRWWVPRAWPRFVGTAVVVASLAWALADLIDGHAQLAWPVVAGLLTAVWSHLVGGRRLHRSVGRSTEGLVPGSVVEIGIGATGIRTRSALGDHQRRYVTIGRVATTPGFVLLGVGQGYQALPRALFTDADLDRVREAVDRAAPTRRRARTRASS